MKMQMAINQTMIKKLMKANTIFLMINKLKDKIKPKNHGVQISEKKI